MKTRVSSKSGGPLVEIIIALVVFVVCGAICLGVFLQSHYTQKYASDITTASMLASSAVEALHGGPDHFVAVIGGETAARAGYTQTYELRYDEKWNATGGAADFTMTVSFNKSDAAFGVLYSGKITVKKTEDYPMLDKQEFPAVLINDMPFSVFVPNPVELDAEPEPEPEPEPDPIPEPDAADTAAANEKVAAIIGLLREGENYALESVWGFARYLTEYVDEDVPVYAYNAEYDADWQPVQFNPDPDVTAVFAVAMTVEERETLSVSIAVSRVDGADGSVLLNRDNQTFDGIIRTGVSE